MKNQLAITRRWEIPSLSGMGECSKKNWRNDDADRCCSTSQWESKGISAERWTLPGCRWFGRKSGFSQLYKDEQWIQVQVVGFRLGDLGILQGRIKIGILHEIVRQPFAKPKTIRSFSKNRWICISNRIQSIGYILPGIWGQTRPAQ